MTELLIVTLLAAGVGATGGYFYVKWNYKDWEEELEKKENSLREVEKYLKKEWSKLKEEEQELKSKWESLQVEKELLQKEKASLEELVINKGELEREVKELKEKLENLQEERGFLESVVKQREEELEELNKKLETLEREVNKLEETKEKLKKGIKAIIRGAEQKAHENLVRELRSLRAQKSAVLDLFDKYPELEEFLRKKEGLGIREYLERAKKLRAKTKNKGE